MELGVFLMVNVNTIRHYIPSITHAKCFPHSNASIIFKLEIMKAAKITQFSYFKFFLPIH